MSGFAFYSLEFHPAKRNKKNAQEKRPVYSKDHSFRSLLQDYYQYPVILIFFM